MTKQTQESVAANNSANSSGSNLLFEPSIDETDDVQHLQSGKFLKKLTKQRWKNFLYLLNKYLILSKPLGHTSY